ncbi:hypothetical protein HPB51_006797 [Rhipicephalus microplus]|uniref:Uncharacterized protein n=1 Tax=Rhipicephalus microplus TaxID=6941 RepID=A0A9J6E8F1_RHIMP|nr:hypothetical protein HPB51_006797 [Rhipicephalus microplus]
MTQDLISASERGAHCAAERDAASPKATFWETPSAAAPRQRLPQKPPLLKPVFLTAPQRPLEDWKACVGIVTVARPNLGWVGKLCLPSEAPGSVTDDDMSIEDTESGVQSRVPVGANNSEAFSTSYCEDNEDYSCTATLRSSSPDSAKTSTTTTTSEAAPPRSLLDVRLNVYENVHRLRRTEEHIAGAVTFRRRRNHRELGQILQHALDDRRSRVRESAPLFVLVSAALAGRLSTSVDTTKSYPGITKRTVPV